MNHQTIIDEVCLKALTIKVDTYSVLEFKNCLPFMDHKQLEEHKVFINQIRKGFYSCLFERNMICKPDIFRGKFGEFAKSFCISNQLIVPAIVQNYFVLQ